MYESWRIKLNKGHRRTDAIGYNLIISRCSPVRTHGATCRLGPGTFTITPAPILHCHAGLTMTGGYRCYRTCVCSGPVQFRLSRLALLHAMIRSANKVEMES